MKDKFGILQDAENKLAWSMIYIIGTKKCFLLMLKVLQLYMFYFDAIIMKSITKGMMI